MIDLQQFCSRSDDIREYLRKPWTYNGYRYGCNGHVMVRMPALNEPDEPADHPMAEKAKTLLLERAAVSKSYIALPSFPAPKRCIGCRGKGQLPQVMCDDCDGDGEFDHGAHTYACKNCEGDGWLPADKGDKAAQLRDCPECHGVGHYRDGAPVGDTHFDVVYLRLLAQLPNVRICTHGYEQGAHFTFDGGEGVLMPRRP